MKQPEKKDYTVSAHDQARKVAAILAPFYQDIHILELNRMIKIGFVPKFEGIDGRRAVLPSDLHRITSANDARLFTTWDCDYLITPTAVPPKKPEVSFGWNYETARAGDAGFIFAIRGDLPEERRRALFFVSSEDFALFIGNLKQIETDIRNKFHWLRYSDLAALPVMQYVEKTVLGSLLVKSEHFAALSRPFESLMRRCVDRLLEHNDAKNRPLVYHGNLNRNGGIENYLSGQMRYEYALLPYMHALPDRRFLPSAGEGRTFWSFIRSTPGRSPQFPFYLIYGLMIWLDAQNNNRLHVECFKIWRSLEEGWEAEVVPQVIPPTTIPDYSKILTFHFPNLDPQEFVERILRYVTGEIEDFDAAASSYPTGKKPMSW